MVCVCAGEGEAKKRFAYARLSSIICRNVLHMTASRFQ